jgi:hypothetical protein
VGFDFDGFSDCFQMILVGPRRSARLRTGW